MGTFDVVIAGGGVGGSATALSLLARDPDLRVAIVERSAYDTVRVGETIPGHTAILLRRLGVWNQFVRQGHLRTSGSCAAWGGPELHFNESTFSAYGAGWHLDRTAFDGLLASQAEARGATVLRGFAVGNPRRRGAGWEMDIIGAARRSIRGRFLVDATGRRTIVARTRNTMRLVKDHLLGMCLLFDDRSTAPDSLTLVEAQANGWWYSATVPGRRIVAAFMTDADIAHRLHMRDPATLLARLRAAPHTSARLGDAVLAGNPTVMLAASRRLDRVAGPGWLAVGDAASTFDPLSSLGIFKALRSGILGSYAILNFLDGDERGLAAYESTAAVEYDAYLAKRTQLYDEERRWPESEFWRRRQTSARLVTESV